MEQNIDEIIEKAKTSNQLQIEDVEISDEHFEKISKLIHLKYLYFRRIKNSQIPGILSNLINLEVITITGEFITQIPSFVFKLSKLWSLDFSNSKISEIPNEILGLPSLKNLDLSNNTFTTFPAIISTLTNLEKFEYDNNKLDEIPKEIFELKKLRTLSLKNNRITSITNELYKLANIRDLQIEDNPLNSLQFGYLYTDEKRDFRFRFHKLRFDENKEDDLFNFNDKNLSFTYNDNLIFFQNEENHGFIRIIDDINELEMHRFFRHKDIYPMHKNSSGFIIYIFGNNKKQLETLNLIRKHIENWNKKNEIQYNSLTSKRKEEKIQKASCMRFFYYRSNLQFKEIKGREFIIDFEKLLEYKSLEKNTYFDDEHGREIDVDDLLKFIGAQNEKIKVEWKGSQYITKIEIENFKIFSKIETELSKNINILIGRNGLGKTSFLQSLTLGLLPISNVDKSNEFEKYISFNFNKSDITLWWSEENRKVLVYKNEIKHENYLDFPQKLILAYGVNLNTDEKLTHTDIIEHLIQGSALPYSTKSIFKDYSIDFYDPLVLLERLFIEKKGKENKLIDNIINLIKTSLIDFLSLFSEPEKILLEGEYADYYFTDLNSNKLKIGNLSEGYKDFILQVTDIIIRIIASRNSVFENKKTDITINLLKNVKGVIIIDEFDRHLHPVLQRKFLEKLSEYFQNIQFILSTHNIFSFQSAEGFTALIINTTDNKLNITKKEISKGLSLESIYNQYFDGNFEIFGNSTEKLLKLFKELINKQRKQQLTSKEKKEFNRITNELLNYGESIKGIVTREVRQLERLTGKTIEL